MAENMGENYHQTRSKHALGATASVEENPDDHDNNDQAVHTKNTNVPTAAGISNRRTIHVGQQDLGQAVVQAIESSSTGK
jgi:hypothetical protein